MEYIIKSGKHATFRIPRLYLGRPKAYKGTFWLAKNCWYARPNEHVDWMDINKLTGLSFGNHLKNSLRIGWRPIFDESKHIELFLYSYNRKERAFHSLGVIQTETEYAFHIQFARKSNIAICKLSDQHELSISYKFPRSIWGYKLFPYFGGNMIAPQEIHIEVQSEIVR